MIPILPTRIFRLKIDFFTFAWAKTWVGIPRFSKTFSAFSSKKIMRLISKLILFSLDRSDGSTSPGFWPLVGADVDHVQCRAQDWKTKTEWIQWKNSRNSGRISLLFPELSKIYKGRISSHLEQYEEDRKNFDKQIAKKVQARTKYVDIGMSFQTFSPNQANPGPTLGPWLDQTSSPSCIFKFLASALSLLFFISEVCSPTTNALDEN